MPFRSTVFVEFALLILVFKPKEKATGPNHKRKGVLIGEWLLAIGIPYRER